MNMKGIVFLLIGLCLGLSSKSQTLEIHQMSVGQGDAALIVVRDTAALSAALTADGVPLPITASRYTMIKLALENNTDLAGTVTYAILIDAGQGSVQGTKIYNYMQKIGVTTLNAAALSHFHADHVAGFKTLANTYGVAPMNAYARTGVASKPKPSATSRASWKAITDLATNKIEVKSDETEIVLKADGTKPIKMTCTASNGKVMYAAANTRVVSNDENNYSISWILQYGAFRFYTGGDLNGMEYTLGDLETPMIDAIKAHDAAVFKDHATDAALNKGHICSFKANHHGGQESSNDYFLSVMKPKVALISCGYSKSYYHPKIEVLKSFDSKATFAAGNIARPNWDITAYHGVDHAGVTNAVANTIQNYFVTSLMVPRDPKMIDNDYTRLYQKVGDLTASNGIIAGDIVLVVDDNDISTQSKFAVYWNAESPPAGVVTGAVKAPAPASDIKYYRCHKSDNAADVKYIPNH